MVHLKYLYSSGIGDSRVIVSEMSGTAHFLYLYICMNFAGASHTLIVHDGDVIRNDYCSPRYLCILWLLCIRLSTGCIGTYRCLS